MPLYPLREETIDRVFSAVKLDMEQEFFRVGEADPIFNAILEGMFDRVIDHAIIKDGRPYMTRDGNYVLRSESVISYLQGCLLSFRYLYEQNQLAADEAEKLEGHANDER